MFKEDCIKIAGEYSDKLETPQKGLDADMTIPCFSLGKNPVEIAEKISKEMKPSGNIKEIKAEGPYVNFYADWNKLSLLVLNKILEKKLIESEKGKTIMIEYSSPNTNKPLHVGHLRNDSIGMSMSNILESVGNKIKKALLFNDRGIHICKSMLAYEKWGENKEPDSKGDHFVGDYYVMFEKNSNDELKKEALEMLKKWEEGDKETRELWEKMTNWVLEGMKETYQRFGSEFDIEYRESENYKKAISIIDEGKKKKVFVETDEGVVSKLEDGDRFVLREDGTSIYITNDLFLTKIKFEEEKIDKSIWVVASEQNFYFKQLFEIFEKLGYEWYKDCHHMSYGLVNLASGRMKTREGNVVDADDLIDKIKELVQKKFNMSEEDAEKISLGAIKYFMLKFDPVKNITFDIENSINLEGNTGPYIQYTYARLNSISKNSKKKIELKSFDDEISLIKKLSAFDSIVNKSAVEMKPSIICNYLFELCSDFNSYYHKKRIIGNENEESLLGLVECLKLVISKGLELLNIKTLEKM